MGSDTTDARLVDSHLPISHFTISRISDHRKKKIPHFVPNSWWSSWSVNWPLQTESNLTLSNFAFSSSCLQRQLAVRPPISIGMVSHVPLAPSVDQGTEWKQNVAKRKTQSAKNVGLDTIGRITRAWNRVWRKLNCTQYLYLWLIFEKYELIKLIDVFSFYVLKASGEFPLWLFTNYEYICTGI